ncbi:hypothetical protein [Pseudomonas sp. R2-7-07]|uniref:hypothetical protein n=1 Tax=Pseudomonas sp. R2-7-07 TaxID=658641 RepID=UPI000F5758AE|nr:hypothetical protein [Pseudomonas sp. R2-7-07]AZF49638.1 hypothetical protein C4J86_4434 [Pseudomonas sp. R2-7-07]
MQTDLLHTLIQHLNMNAIALESTTEDLGRWINNAGATTTAAQLSRQLEVIEENAQIIARVLAGFIHPQSGNSAVGIEKYRYKKSPRTDFWGVMTGYSMPG